MIAADKLLLYMDMPTISAGDSLGMLINAFTFYICIFAHTFMETHTGVCTYTYKNVNLNVYIQVYKHVMQPVTHCNTLQHTATHCNTLLHTATHCNTLQRIVYPNRMTSSLQM